MSRSTCRRADATSRHPRAHRPRRVGTVALCAAVMLVHVSARATTGSGAASRTLPGVLAPDALDAPSAEMLLEVRLNGVLQPEAVRALMRAGRVALGPSDWQALHLKPPVELGVLHDGERYQMLDALAGLRWSVDAASQTLVIDAPASAFAGMQLGLDATASVMAPADRWGGFANYDLAWQRNGAAAVGMRRDWTHALVDAGTFGPSGTGRISALMRDDGTQPHAVRLDTNWTLDRPEHMDSLRIGDGIGRAGAWGRALRFGGVQWSTDFSTQPGFLSFPLPAVRGEATLPSTLEVYVNNTRRAQSQLPAGPFELKDLPIVTGSGQVRVVVRDLLGREQVIVQPYAMSPELLRPGLHSFSYELGPVREDYGLNSNRYGRLMAAATDRLGVNDSFTRELRGEVLGRQGAFGATGMWQLDSLALVSLSGVASHGPHGNGALWAAAAEHRGATWNGGFQIRTATRDFTQMGQGAEGTPRIQSTLTAGGMLGGTAVGLSLVHQRTWDGTAQRLLTFNLSHSVGQAGSIGLFALRDMVAGSTTLAVGYTMSLDARTSASVNSSAGRSTADGATHRSRATTVQLQRNPPEDTGLGYTLEGTTSHDQSDTQRATAQVVAQTERATFTAALSQGRNRADGGASTSSSDLRAGVSGGVAWLDNSVFMSRRIDGSFAVVEVADYPGVQVLHDHHPVARTDANGRALIPGLRGYEPNRIGIDAADLPFDAEVEALEVDLTPPSRSGVVLRVPVRRNRAASLRLVDASGEALPAGSMVQVPGRAQGFPVGFDGRSFISGLLARTPISVRWPGGECAATLALDLESYASADDLPDLGTVSCR